MLTRKAYEQLLAWHSGESTKRKALLVTGARQVGKSYLIRHLGNSEYEVFVEVNLLENKEAQKTLAQAQNTKDLLNRLAIMSNLDFKEGKTLIFIDEIQEYPDIMTFAKFLVEDGRYDFAFSGSMLGTEFKGVRSFPVGFVKELKMRPLDFEEFCWATGLNAGVLSVVRSSFEKMQPVDEYIHGALLAAFRNYVIVGGMPEVVQHFVDNRENLSGVRTIQTELNKQYSYDISKYAAHRALHVQEIFDALPVQLEAEKAKFTISDLGSNARYNQYERDFLWLVNAGVGLKVNKVTEPKPPLRRTERTANFKLYQSDTGMLVSRFMPSFARAIYEDSRTVNMGGIFENIIAQELVAADFVPRYFAARKFGEVDFLVEADSGVIAIEVKSGGDYLTHASLSKVMSAPGFDISRAIVLCRSNFAVKDGILYAPWYASVCFGDLAVA